MQQNKNMKHRWLIAIKQLAPMILTLSCAHQKWHLIQDQHKLVEHLIKYRGEAQAIKDVKSYRTWIQQYIANQKPSPIAFRKIDIDGFPKVLKPWKSLVNGSTSDKRLCLSLWRITDNFRCEPKLDVSTIVEKSTGDKTLITEFCTWITSWEGLKALPKVLPKNRIILSNRAGPNGPATASAFRDLSALSRDKNLYKAVEGMIKIFPLGQYTGDLGDYKHSKLIFISDKACKTRVIAIGDWWSNIALSPIHDAFMHGLSNLKQDMTYRQGDIPKVIRNLGKSLYTSDMTAFTDRFPILMEEAVVSAAYGRVIGTGWKTIISNRDFDSPLGKTRYATGNPMGLLSSWAVSSFTHHAVKQWCAHLLGIPKYKYLVLGDDCLDTNKEVFKLYCSVIDRIGVSINLGKCTQSEIGFAEFAKRIFSPLGELTGLPVDLLEGIKQKPEQFIELVRIMRNRGYSESEISTGVQTLLTNFHFRDRKTILFVLSSPHELLGMPPLVLMEGDTQIVQPPCLQGAEMSSLKQHIEQARREVFWEEVDKIVQPPANTGSSVPSTEGQMHIPENHPALAGIGELLNSSYPLDTEEFSVYENWMSGKDYGLVQVPSINLYRYRNRSHKATRSRYEILKRTKAFADGIKEYRTQLPDKISNWDLMLKGFPS